MKLEKIKTYKQIDGSINYVIDGIEPKKLNDIYLQLCNKYTRVLKFLHSFINGKYYGYFNCKY